MADKVTVNHKSSQIMEFRISISDAYRYNLFHALYQELKYASNFTELGLASNILNTLKKFGLNQYLLRRNLVGLGIKKQYIKLRADNHLKKKKKM